ncbi:hypothetical protein COHA_000313 [Chlorella ohadii]|uniref:Nucleolar complex-associated protein 3 N-terminal domain-containing protein n=1 Tax=Chlorella ohadii TaxID=2649997 RepID=A0AAD5HA19_9CHLO|nr:hypothetical protein COHA_000313 [Chlorella ohadii]
MSSCVRVQGGLKLLGADSGVMCRELRRQTAKQQLALAAQQAMQDPEKQLPKLTGLLEFVQDEDPQVCLAAMRTLLAVFKDLIPARRISPVMGETPDELSKDARALQAYEAALLDSCNAFLEALLRTLEAWDACHATTKQGFVAAECVAGLLDAAPHLNYRSDLLQALVVYLPVTIREYECIWQSAQAGSAALRTSSHGNGDAAIEAVQVQGGLRLIGADAVYLASSGTLVTRLDQLQDSVETSVSMLQAQGKTQPVGMDAFYLASNGKRVACLDHLPDGEEVFVSLPRSQDEGADSGEEGGGDEEDSSYGNNWWDKPWRDAPCFKRLEDDSDIESDAGSEEMPDLEDIPGVRPKAEQKGCECTSDPDHVVICNCLEAEPRQAPTVVASQQVVDAQAPAPGQLAAQQQASACQAQQQKPLQQAPPLEDASGDPQRDPPQVPPPQPTAPQVPIEIPIKQRGRWRDSGMGWAASAKKKSDQQHGGGSFPYKGGVKQQGCNGTGRDARPTSVKNKRKQAARENAAAVFEWAAKTQKPHTGAKKPPPKEPDIKLLAALRFKIALLAWVRLPSSTPPPCPIAILESIPKASARRKPESDTGSGAASSGGAFPSIADAQVCCRCLCLGGSHST